MASSPRILKNRQAPSDAEAMQKESPCRRSSSLRVLRRQSLPRRRPGALRNTSDARRQAAKLCYRFGPLTPSARSANLIAGDGTKNGFPAPNKEPAKTKNHHLTGKAPYKFESISLQRQSIANLSSGPSPFASPWSAYLLQINAMTREFLRTEGSSRRRARRLGRSLSPLRAVPVRGQDPRRSSPRTVGR